MRSKWRLNKDPAELAEMKALGQRSEDDATLSAQDRAVATRRSIAASVATIKRGVTLLTN